MIWKLAIFIGQAQYLNLGIYILYSLLAVILSAIIIWVGGFGATNTNTFVAGKPISDAYSATLMPISAAPICGENAAIIRSAFCFVSAAKTPRTGAFQGMTSVDSIAHFLSRLW